MTVPYFFLFQLLCYNKAEKNPLSDGILKGIIKKFAVRNSVSHGVMPGQESNNMSEQSQAVQIFNFRGNETRALLIDGEPWFVVNDACKILEIANVGNAISRLDKDGVRQADVIDSLGRKQSTTVANEPNLYRLIFRSDKPEAKAFQDWVYRDVLPSIRKTGQYGHPTLVSVRGDHFLNVNQIDDIKTIDVTIGKLQQQKRTLLAIAQRKLGVIAHGARVPLTPEEQDQLLIFHASTMKESCARNIGRRIKRSIPEVRFHLEELVERGLLWREPSPSGRTVYYRPIQQKQLA